MELPSTARNHLHEQFVSSICTPFCFHAILHHCVGRRSKHLDISDTIPGMK